jgi:polysaccharide deacetylase family protein (PEP-CTERM system associated)
MRNALTVDVEDWFQVSNFDGVIGREEWGTLPSRVERNTVRMLDLFDEFDARATCFVLGWVAERFPELVREIARRGHEIASHGHGHELVYRIGPERFEADVRRSVESLNAACGETPRGYRAPSFSIDRRAPWAFDVLAELGFTYDSSLFPVWHPRYGVGDFERFPCRVRTAGGREMTEFPLTTMRLAGRNLGASGGGYLRIFPLAVMETAFRRANAAGQPAVLYLHPWEIDPDQPRIRVGGLGRFTHYANLAGTEGRLRRLLQDFSWTTMSEALVDAPGLGAEPRAVPA